MKYKLVLLLTLLTSIAFSDELAGSSSISNMLYIKTRNGERNKILATAAFTLEGDKSGVDTAQMFDFKLNKVKSNKYSLLQYNFSIYQGLYEANNYGESNGLYDFAGINGSIIGAIKLPIGPFELCYGVSFGCSAEMGSYIDFIDEITGEYDDPIGFYSGLYGAWFIHLNADTYISVQSLVNSEYLNQTSFLFMNNDMGVWFSAGYYDYSFNHYEHYYEASYSKPCFAIGITLNI